jgi:hypothetical protein
MFIQRGGDARGHGAAGFIGNQRNVFSRTHAQARFHGVARARHQVYPEGSKIHVISLSRNALSLKGGLLLFVQGVKPESFYETVSRLLLGIAKSEDTGHTLAVRPVLGFLLFDDDL